MRRVNPVIVGITGGIASGKSEVAQILQAKGYTVVNSDDVAKALYHEPDVVSQLQRLVPFSVVLSTGEINRDKLRGAIFHDPRLKRDVEAVIHPIVIRRILETIMKKDPGQSKFNFVESALMIESGFYKKVDLLVAVECDVDRQRERLLARGIDSETIKAILAAQLTSVERKQMADYVIPNTGSLYTLSQSVNQLVQWLKQRKMAKRG